MITNHDQADAQERRDYEQQPAEEVGRHWLPVSWISSRFSKSSQWWISLGPISSDVLFRRASSRAARFSGSSHHSVRGSR